MKAAQKQDRTEWLGEFKRYAIECCALLCVWGMIALCLLAILSMLPEDSSAQSRTWPPVPTQQEMQQLQQLYRRYDEGYEMPYARQIRIERFIYACDDAAAEISYGSTNAYLRELVRSCDIVMAGTWND